VCIRDDGVICKHELHYFVQRNDIPVLLIVSRNQGTDHSSLLSTLFLTCSVKAFYDVFMTLYSMDALCYVVIITAHGSDGSIVFSIVKIL